MSFIKFKKSILLILFVIGFSQEHHVSIGFLDHKTGNSFVGYARTILKHQNHEIFIGFGTLLAMNTLSAGWKYYISDSPIKFYSVLSTQGIAGMGGLFIAPAISIGIEKKITKKLFMNLGINSNLRIYANRPMELIAFPNITFLSALNFAHLRSKGTNQ